MGTRREEVGIRKEGVGTTREEVEIREEGVGNRRDVVGNQDRSGWETGEMWCGIRAEWVGSRKE